jgi:hypothetical protein
MSNSSLDHLVEKEPKELKLELDIKEINIIMGILQELPHRVVDGLLKKIFSQVQPQVQ